MKAPAEHRWVDRSTLAWLLFAQAIAILPLFFFLPFWVPFIWIFALIWRIQIYRGAWGFPSNSVKAALGFFSIAALVFSYAGTFGVEPLVGFLVISFVLKLVEVKSRSDVLIVIYVGFIAVAAQFLFFQTFLIAAYGLLSAIALISAWNCIYRTRSVSIRRQWMFSIGLIIQSMPLMLLLFLVLPRLGNLWHVPIPKSTGTTGFSDSMSPGDFSRLSKSRAVAFRVSFEGNAPGVALPGRNEWYWRGLVLDDFDGRRWKNSERFTSYRAASGRSIPNFWNLAVSDDAQYIRYNVLMEPHQQRWLFSMMAPVSVRSSTSKLYFAPDFLVKSSQAVANKMQYQVISTRNYMASPVALSNFDRLQNTQIPPGSNPQARSLADQWTSEGLGSEEIVNRALRMYRADFTYTLQPPALGKDTVDEFLFQTKRGFCEHFSSSFVFLMRAATIPARVVVGYQGGEINEIENYIIVRQQDAHAWTEVWIENRGWIRVDPTSAVSPSRIEQGLQQSLSENEQRMVQGLFNSGLLTRIQLRLDAFNYSWQRWVLGYDAQKQASIFQRFLGGQEAWRIGVIFFLTIAGILLAYFTIFTWRGRKRYEYPEHIIFARLQRKLAKKGYTMEKGETENTFARRVASEHSHWQSSLMEIIKLYQRVAYENSPSAMNDLKDAVNKFKAD